MNLKKIQKIVMASVAVMAIFGNTANVQAQDKTESNTVTIRAIGDILMHDAVYNSGWQEDGTLKYDFMFEPVKHYIENADITIANMETIVAGQEFGLSSYPQFNAPAEIIDTLKNIGVDIINNTSNHSMDGYVEGALMSIQNIKARNMMYVGAYESWEDYNTPRVIEKNGIKVGFLAYSYGTNGIPIPEGQEYLATQIDETLMPLEVKRLQNYADATFVVVEAGEEYEEYPNDYQIALHDLLVEAGTNFIWGGHPHVLEPFKVYNDTSASLFSHANFLSAQIETNTKIGGISEITLKKEQNKVTVDKIRFMPTYNPSPSEAGYYVVVPLADATPYIDVDYWFDHVTNIMTAYSDEVEVVKYLD